MVVLGDFNAVLAGGYDGPIIVSEGDSWFQYPLLLKDTIDHVMNRYAVMSLGAAGDLLNRMADKQEYVRAVQETGADIPDLRVARRQVVEIVAREPERPGQAERRKPQGLGDADARGLRGQRLRGLPDIGTPFEQFGRQTDRHLRRR